MVVRPPIAVLQTTSQLESLLKALVDPCEEALPAQSPFSKWRAVLVLTGSCPGVDPEGNAETKPDRLSESLFSWAYT